MKPCKACSCSGIYVDYDPRVQSGGIAVDCKVCRGRGWLGLPDEPEFYSFPPQTIVIDAARDAGEGGGK